MTSWKCAGMGMFAGLCFALAGCSASTDTASPEESTPRTAGSTSAKLLAVVELESGHSVNFYELQGGGISVFERASGQDTSPVLKDALKTLSPVEIYGALAPKGTAVPKTLLDAQQRFASARATKSLDSVPKGKPSDLPAVSDERSGPSYYHGDEQQWFDANFCHMNYTHECLVFGRGTLATQWWPGAVGFSAGFANYAGGATFNIFWFDFQPVNVFSLHLNANEAWWQFVFFPGSYTYFTANIIHDEPRHPEASSYLTIATEIP